MAPIPLSFGLASNKGKLGLDVNVRVVNAYARALSAGGKTDVSLVAAPGLKPWLALSTGPYRGALVVADMLYVVSGRVLYAITAAGDATELAGIPGDGVVQFAANALDQPDIMLCASGKLWTIKGGVCAPFDTDAITGTVVDVDFIRGRFVIGLSNGQFYYTRINSTEVEGDAFYNAEGKPDGLVGLWVRRNEVWLIGTESVELWAPTTDPDDPFGPLGAGALPIGCASAATIAENNDDIFWVDNRNQVRRANGYTPKEISPEWVVETIEAEPDKGSLVGFTHSLGGVNWYTLRGSTFTLCYNMNTNQWTERETLGRSTWRGLGAAGFAGRTLIGDDQSGQLWELAADYPMDGTIPIQMRLQSPIVHAWPMPLSINSLHVDVLSAVTAQDLDATDRSVTLRLSEDGGRSWFAPLTHTLGARGASTRVVFRQLGHFERQGATIELRLPALSARSVMAAVINGQQGST